MTWHPYACQPVKSQGTDSSRDHAAKSIHLFKHSLVFTALSETDKYIAECERGGGGGMNKKWNPICQNIPMSMPDSVFWRALCNGAANQNNRCFLPRGQRKRKQTEEQRAGFSYHGHHLQVLHIRPFCGQQLLGDEVGPVRWEPLQREETVRTTELSNSCLVFVSWVFLWVDL